MNKMVLIMSILIILSDAFVGASRGSPIKCSCTCREAIGFDSRVL
jgi:hypothetical protein